MFIEIFELLKKCSKSASEIISKKTYETIRKENIYTDTKTK